MYNLDRAWQWQKEHADCARLEGQARQESQVMAKLAEHGLTIWSRDCEIRQAFRACAGPATCMRIVRRMRKGIMP